MKRLSLLVCFCRCLTAIFEIAATADDGTVADVAPIPFAERVLTITDVVLSQHIDPPTRQEMILAGVKALHQSTGRRPPHSLSTDISGLATREQFTEFLNSAREEFDSVTDVEARFMAAMLQAVPGNAALTEGGKSEIAQQIAANRYVGIGVTIGARADRDTEFWVFHEVIYNGPAWHAGAKDGDLIEEIDGDSMRGKGTSDLVHRLRGKSGTDVTLTLRQQDETESRTITVTRGLVFIPTVQSFNPEPEEQSTWTLDFAPDIAFVRIVKIGPSTLHELRQVDAALQEDDVQGIIVDLRVGDGILHDTILVADGLLDGGTIGHVQTVRNRRTYNARPGALFNGLKMAVLTSRDSDINRAFLATALQDSGRAVVVGTAPESETHVSSFVDVPGSRDQLWLATASVQRDDDTPPPASGNMTLPRVFSKAGVATPQGHDDPRRAIGVPDHEVSSPTELFGFNPLAFLHGADADPPLKVAIGVLRNTDDSESIDPDEVLPVE